MKFSLRLPDAVINLLQFRVKARIHKCCRDTLYILTQNKEYRMHHTKIRSMLMLSATVIVMLTGISLVPLLAQDNATIVTVAIEDWQGFFFF